jgi:hypothetical protein
MVDKKGAVEHVRHCVRRKKGAQATTAKNERQSNENEKIRRTKRA